MVFASVEFLTLFLPLFFVAYFVVPRRGRNLVLLLASPRSGSSLLQLCLSVHPLLLADQEYHLLSFGSMAERQGQLRPRFLAEGLNESLSRLSGVAVAQMRR